MTKRPNRARPRHDATDGVRIVGLRRCSRGALLSATALRAAALVVLAARTSAPAFAQLAAGAHPSGGVVVGGSASISQSGNTTDITQRSGRAAIDWQSFNVGSAAKVVFQQPSSSAVALNTVVGPDPSVIAGRITANGVIAIVNQSGVLFAQGSQVDTAGLVVSAAGISRQNFMSGHMVFDQAAQPGARVVNNGAITIRQAGLAALVAPQVVNNGLITAKLGRVILGGAATYTLDLYGDGLLALNVTGQVTQVQLGGRVIPALVTNAGTILADGGTVVLNAAAADGLIRTLVEAGGTVQANTVGSQAGRVVVEGIGGSVDIAGAVSATGAAPGTRGGTIVADATGTVSLASTARVNASGSAGGGLIGLGTTAARAASRSAHSALTAQAVDVAAGAQIAASAMLKGDGGQVTLLSTENTSLAGAISVLGGTAGGNGGTAEVSGTIVDLTGLVSGAAPLGRIGSLFIDPANTVVADVNPTKTGYGFLSDVSLSQSSAGITISNTGTIDFAYDPGKTNSVTSTSTAAGAVFSVTSTLGTINVDAGFTLTSATSLSLTANQSVNFDATTGKSVFGFASTSTSSSVLSAPTVSLVGTTGVSLGSATITGTTSLDLTSALGAIAGSGKLSTALLAASATTGIDLSNTGNAISKTGAVNTTADDITIDNGGALTIGGAMTATAGNVTLDTGGALTINSTITGGALKTVSLTVAAGGVTEAAAGPPVTFPGAIDAATLTASITGGAAVLQGNNSIADLGAVSATGATSDILIIDGEAVQVTGLVSAGRAVALASGGASSGITVTNTGSLAAGGSAPIQLIANNFSLVGGVTTGGLVTFGRNSAGALNVGGLIATDSFDGHGLGAVSAGVIALGSDDGATADTKTTSLDISQSLGSTGVTLGLFAAGPITEVVSNTVTMTAALLEGASTSGDVSLAGTNVITSLGGFTSTGSLALADTEALTTKASTSQSAQTGLTITLAGAASTLGLAGSLTAGSATLIAPGGISETAGTLSATSLSATAASGAIGIAEPGNAFGTVSGMSAHGSIDLSTGGSLQLTGLVAAGGAATLDAGGGNLTEGSGGTITAASLTGSASAGVSLVSSNNSFTTLDALTASSGAITLTTGSVLSIGGSVSATGSVGIGVTGAGDTLAIGAGVTGSSVALAAPGAITQTAGSITATSTSVSLTSSAGGIVLDTTTKAPANGGSIVLTADGSITETASGSALSAQDLAGSASTGSVSLTGTNSIGTITGLTAATSLAYDNSASLLVSGLVKASAGTLSLSAPGQTVTGTLDASTSLTLTSAGGTIDASGNVTATTLTGSAGGAVSLDGTNDVGTLAAFSTTGGGFSLHDTIGLAVSGLVQVSTGTDLLLQAPSITVDASPGSLVNTGGTISLATDALTLNGGANTGSNEGLIGIDRLSKGALSVGASSFASLTTGTVAFGSLDGTTTSGNVTLITITGALSVPDALDLFTSTSGSVSAPAGISVGTLSGSVGSISFAGTESIGTLKNFTVAGGGLSLTDRETLILAGHVNAGGVAVLDVTGDLTERVAGVLSGALTATSLSGSASGLIDLGDTANSFAVLAGLTATGGPLTVSDASALSVTGGVSSGAALTLAVIGGTNGLALNAGAALTATGSTVTLSSTAGTISEVASANISATTLTGSAGGSLSLAGTANHVGTLGALSAGGLLTVDDAEALDVSGNIDSDNGSAALSVTVSTGSLVIGAGASVFGSSVSLESKGALSELATGQITSGASGAVLKSDTGGISLSAGVTATGGTVTFTAPGGSVVENAGALITANAVTGTATAFDLQAFNQFNTITNLSATAGTATIFLVPTTGTIEVAGDVSASTTLSITDPATGHAANITGALSAGEVDLSDASGITEISTASIAAGTLTANASAGPVSLTSTGNAVSTLGTSSSTGGFALTDSATSSGGYTGTLTVTGNVTAGSMATPATLALTAPALTSSGTLSALGGTVALASDKFSLSGSITTGTGQGVVGIDTFAGSSLTVHGAGDFGQITTGLLALGSLDGATASSHLATLSITGNLDLGSTTTLGLFTTPTGTVTSSAGITASTLIGTAGTVSLTGANSITTLGTFLAAGGLTFSQPTSLTVSGLVEGGSLASASVASPSVGISLTEAASTLTVSGTINSAIATLSAGDLTLSGKTGASGLLVLTATSGTISETGTLNAGTLTGSAFGAASLDGNNDSNSIGTLGAFSATGFSLADGSSLSVTGALDADSEGSGGAVLSTASGTTLDIAAGGSITGASASLSTTGLTIEGSIDVGGTISLTAATIDEHLGTLEASAVTGSATGTANLASGNNSFTTLDGFTAAGLSVQDGASLTLLGSIDGTGAVAVTADAIDIGSGASVRGTTSVSLTATAGTIAETGSTLGLITAGSLTGSSGGSATSLTGANSITALGDFTADGFTLDQAGALSVTGDVQAGASAVLAGMSTLSIGGTLAAAHTGLSVGSLSVTGSLAGTTSLSITAASVSETGQITAGTLIGTLTGGAVLTGNGNNSINDLGSLTLAGGLTLLDSGALTVLGPVSGTVLSLTAGDITIRGSVTGTTSVALNATSAGAAGTISESGAGLIDAPTLTGSAAGSVSLFGAGANLVGTLGGFSAGGFELTDFEDLKVTGPLTSSGGATLTASGHTVDVTGAIEASDVTISAGDITIPGSIAGTAAGSLQTLTLQASSAGTATGSISASGIIDAQTLTGSAGASALFTIASGNTIGTLASFSTGGAFTLEDDVSPDITGPLTIGTTLDIHGPNGGGTGGTTDFILDANISAATLSFDSGAGIVQLGGSVQTTTGDLTLQAANGIIQLAGDATGTSVLQSAVGNLNLSAGGTAATTSGGITATGIHFAGTLAAGSVATLVASAGDIAEAQGARLIAFELAGSSTQNGTVTGQTRLDVTTGNDIAVIGGFTASGNLLIEDDVLPSISGPLQVGGAFSFAGASAALGAEPISGNTDLILDGAVNVTGAASFTSDAGIVQQAGAVVSGGDLTLTAANGIGQAAATATLASSGGNLNLTAGGAAATSVAAATTTGIDFAGTLSAATGTATLFASAGDIDETQGGRLIASSFAGSTTLGGTATGAVLLNVTTGNDIATFGSFTTSGDLLAEDDVLPTVAGPLSIGGNLALTGPTAALAADPVTGFTDLVLTGSITVAGAASLQSFAGIAQTGGSLTAGGDVTLLAANGIVQAGGALLDSTGGNLGLTADGGAATVSSGVTTTGIAFAGTLSATANGTVSLVAGAGDNAEQPTGQLLATTLTGSSAAAGTFTGKSAFEVPSGNSIGTLASFTTSGDFDLEDDISPDVTGPLKIGGSLAVNGPNNGGTGSLDLILDAVITAGGSASFDSAEGIVQTGGSVASVGGLTLTAANGIVQSSGTTLSSTGGNATLTAGGAAATSSGAITTTGIDFAGTLSATGTATLIASAGDIVEDPATGQLVAGSLAGSATASGNATGQANFGAASGNSISILASFTTGGDFILEDDISPDIAGPLTIGGSLDVHGPNDGGTGPGGGTAPLNLVLDASITTGGSASFDSGTGIVQLGGTVDATGDLTLLAGNGIVQFAHDAVGTAVLTSGGNLSLTAGGAAATTATGTLASGTGSVSAAGISFAGTVSAANGTASLTASAGDILEDATSGRLLAGVLTGSSTAGGTFTGQTILDVSSGNTVLVIDGYASSAGFTLEDDVSPTLEGTLAIGGAIDIHGPNGGATGSGADLILDADITAGSGNFDSGAGIIQLGGTVETGGNLTLTAAHGIVQAAGDSNAGTSVLMSDAGVLQMTASGLGTTTSGALSASGIGFAGTLSSVPGQVKLVASAGDIIEAPSGQLLAGTLTGSSDGSGTIAGQSLFEVSSGNSINIVGSFTTLGDFTLEDDISPDIAGPLTASSGSIFIHGPNDGGTGPGLGNPVTDFTLDADITAGQSINFDSGVGIVQLGGAVVAQQGSLTLLAANGIVQLASNAVGTSVLKADVGNLSLTANGGATTSAGTVTTTGIDFAGTLSSAAATTTLVAGAGNINEAQGARLIAATLTGSSAAAGSAAGSTSLDVTSGNFVNRLASFTTSGDFTLEDDVSPAIDGPLSIGGALDIHGPNGGGTGGGDLILDANIGVGGSASFDSGRGIVQLGGDVTAGGNLSLVASDGIVQFTGDATGASVLASTGGELSLQASGAGTTSSAGTLAGAPGTLSATGIAFAGTLSADSTVPGEGTVSLVASAGDIVEQPTGQLLATLLTGAATAGSGAVGQSLFDVSGGNSVSILGSYSTSAAFTLEDDVSPTITGPVHAADGSITIHGPLVSGTRTGTGTPADLDLVLDGDLTAGGTGSSVSLDSAGGIIQLGGTVTAAGNLTLLAGNGIIQAAGDAAGTSTIVSSAGNLSFVAAGGAATTSNGITSTGIGFAGTLSATSAQAGTMSLVADAGDIIEQPTGRMFARVLTGSAAANGTVALGQALFDVAGGNTVTIVGSFTTAADFVLEDDLSPDITGPLVIGGSLDVFGPGQGGTGGAVNLVLDADISTVGSASFNSATGIVQLGGTVQSGTDLILQAGNGIVQAAGDATGAAVLAAGTDLTATAAGAAATVSNGVTTTGISFAGTISSTGTATLVATAGDIAEQSTGRLLAGTLAGSATVDGVVATGQALVDVAGGNSVTTLGSFATSAGFILEDDISPDIEGPLTAGGAIDIHGPNGAGTGGPADMILNAVITAGGSASFDSAVGIVQTGGSVQSTGDLTLLAGNGIIQYTPGTSLRSIAGKVGLTATGGGSTSFGSIATSGISFAGTLAAQAGTMALVAAAGDIFEQPTGILLAKSLTGAATAKSSVAPGQALFDVASGNTVTTLASFTTSAGFSLEDDVSPTIAGPLAIGGALDIHGPNGGGTGGGDLILDANIGVGGAASFDSGFGIVQLGGTVQSGGDLTLLAANGIIQAAGDAVGPSVLKSTGGNLYLAADGAAATASGGTTATGISFAGTLSAATGTVSLSAAAGDIIEQPTGQLVASTLTGSATALAGTAPGQALFDVAAGNTVTTLAGFATSGNFALEDDRSPTVTGPLTAGGSIAIHGPNGGGTGVSDMILDADITAAGSASFDSGEGIVQSGGSVQAGGDLSLTAANGISFAGTLSATAGTVTLLADAGDITETPSGKLLAASLAGSATAHGTSAGSALFEVTAGNAVSNLRSFSASGDINLEDDNSPTVTGPVTAGGSIDIHGANGGGTGGTIVLDGALTAQGGSLSLDSAGGIVQQAGTAQAATSLTLLAGAGISLSGTVVAPDVTMLAAAGSIIGTGSATVSASTLTGSAAGSLVLTGPNSIATLGSFTAVDVTLNDLAALTIAGPLAGGPSTSITAASLTVPGTITTGTLTLSIGGTVSETGAIDVTLLDGTAAGDARFTGSNMIGTLGNFAAPSLVLDDAASLVIAGLVSGDRTANTLLSITSSGSLTETGSIVTGLLTLSSAGSASLTGSNDIGTLGNASADGLTLDNSIALAVTGTVNGQGAVVLSDAGALTIAASGSIAGSTSTLTAASMTIAGALDAGTDLHLVSAGGIGETGRIDTPKLTGSAGGSADFLGTNQIAAVGDFTAGGSFVLQDVPGVSFDGALNATGGNIGITAADITEQGGASIVTGVQGPTATTGTITLASVGTMTLAGLIDAPTILVGDTLGTPTLVTFADNTVITGSSVPTGAHHPPFPRTNGSRPGLFVLGDKFLQTGTTRVNPSGKASTVVISLARRNGTVTFDPSYTAGLLAPSSELFLNLNFGVASGHIDVAGLTLSFVQPGSTSLTDLYGTIDNETGPAAAGAAYIVQPNSNYRFNTCPIQSINCILVSPVIVPIVNPVEDIEVTTPRRRRDDDDLIIPNVGEQDF